MLKFTLITMNRGLCRAITDVEGLANVLATEGGPLNRKVVRNGVLDWAAAETTRPGDVLLAHGYILIAFDAARDSDPSVSRLQTVNKPAVKFEVVIASQVDDDDDDDEYDGEDDETDEDDDEGPAIKKPLKKRY